MKKRLLFLLLASQPTFAFTLLGHSNIKGWDTSELRFRVNLSNCPVSEDQMNQAIDAAMAVWNEVPTSGIRLERGESTTTTAAEARAGSAENGTPTPLIVCDPDLSATLGTSTEFIPAAARPGASSSLVINYGYLLLNAESGRLANIENLSFSKLTIVIAHEIGHVLGLGHTSDKASLMYFDATARRELNLSQDDQDGLTYLYPRHEIGSSGVLGCGSIDSYRDDSKRPGPPGGALEVTLLGCFLAAATWIFKRALPIRVQKVRSA